MCWAAETCATYAAGVVGLPLGRCSSVSSDQNVLPSSAFQRDQHKVTFMAAVIWNTPTL